MNERIKELAGYVEKYISTTNFEGMPEDEMTYDEIFQKKFAELLLKDCVQILDRRNEHPVIVNSIKEIKETFGV